ncbi:MAG: ABC transporter permease [Chloroflexi bacterium]|nr:MAG: ABC transporter permease [Chloroflexota bacterium]
MSTVSKQVDGRGRTSSRREITYGLIFLGAGLLIFGLFARGGAPEQKTAFVLNPAGESQAIPVSDVVVPSLTALYVLALTCVFFGGWQLARGFRRVNLALGAVAALFVLAFLIWAARGKSLNLTGLLSSALLRSVPIALAGLSGVLCERCAVINIAIEGMMLTGAFAATLMGSVAANVWEWPKWAALPVGLVSALASGALLGLLLAVLAVRFKIDQIIAGTAINILSVGITSFLSSRIMAEFEYLNRPGTFTPFSIPLLANIPIIGPVFFEQNVLVYTLFILLVVIHVMLLYTRWGLRTRAVGEHPRAADTLGIDVFKNRYVNVTLGGMVGALGGAFLILGSVGRFDELMTAGKGFIGLAAMIFGNWMPFGAFGAALIFGFADALQTKLAILKVPIPSQFMLMAPYLVTMVVLAGVVGEAIPPAADGQPYEKQ